MLALRPASAPVEDSDAAAAAEWAVACTAVTAADCDCICADLRAREGTRVRPAAKTGALTLNDGTRMLAWWACALFKCCRWMAAPEDDDDDDAVSYVIKSGAKEETELPIATRS